MRLAFTSGCLKTWLGVAFEKAAELADVEALRCR